MVIDAGAKRLTAIDLSVGGTTTLDGDAAGPWCLFFSPALSADGSVLYYRDSSGDLAAISLADSSRRVMARAEKQEGIRWVLLSRDSADLYYMVATESGSERIRKVELVSGNVSQVCDLAVSGAEAFWLAPGRLLLAQQGTMEHATVVLYELRLGSGTIRELRQIPNAWYACPSRDGTKVCVSIENTEDYVIYDMSSFRELDRFSTEMLPGGLSVASPFCWIGERYVFLMRWPYGMPAPPAESYLYDTQTGAYKKVADFGARNPRYFAVPPGSPIMRRIKRAS